MGIVDRNLDHASAEPLFDTLISCVSDGILVTDEDNRVLCVNAAFLDMMGGKGLTPTELIEKLNVQTWLSQAAQTTDATVAYFDQHSHQGSHQGSHRGSPLNAFSQVQETIRIGGIVHDITLFLGVVPAKDGSRRFRIILAQDCTPATDNASTPHFSQQNFITHDREMLSILSRLEQIADSPAPVLLMGESGTGKTQIARMIHKSSPRSRTPLIEVNCAAIPEQLLESELFGHVKGAFTGATQSRKGRFQAAHGSTILLDEIGEIPLHLQAKLLRAIQDQRFEPVGSDQTVEVDVRVISATNQDLRKMVNQGRFRADLFYRLAVVPIQIPPLRERISDIPLLLKHFCTDLTARGYPEDVSCTPEAMRLMMDYPWPGNVREMLNAVEHAYICAIDKAVVPESLPQDIRQFSFADTWLNDEGRTFVNSPHSNATSGPAYARIPPEAQEIVRTLTITKGNKSAAAKMLGVDRTTLWRRMRKFGLA